MIRLRDRTTSPPNGFMFFQAETGWDSRKMAPDTRWDFKQLVKAVRQHRHQFPHFNLTTDPNKVAEEVDRQNANRIAGIADADSFIIREPAAHCSYFFIGPVNGAPHIATQDDVSAVICIYKPTAETLNKCLQHVMGQVHDIVVVVDQAGLIPEEAMDDPKIRYIQMAAHDIGYGRKANYGVRYTKGQYLWLLNDDVFVAPDCCEKLLEVLRSDESIGMVGHELRYPDGRLQHGGTARGDFIGFGHVDSGQHESRFKHPIEVENVTGASIIVRHPAFFQAGCFSEDYYLYCEDNDLCLSMRRAGWKIFYTPHAKAEHIEHASTKNTPGLQERLQQSLKIFELRWGWYFSKNKNNPGLGVFQ